MMVLVIESNEKILNEIKKIFSMSHYEIKVCSNADKAVFALKEAIPQIILVNSLESLKPGKTVLSLLHNRKEYGGIPLIAYCRFDDESMIRAIIASEADDYIRYPFIGEELIGKINHYSRKYEGNRELSGEPTVNRRWLDQIRTVSNDGVFAWDIITNESTYDSRYYIMAGYEPNEFPSQYEEWKKRVHPGDFPHTQVQANTYIKGDLPDSDDEFRFRRKDGSWMWIRSSIKFVQRDKDGQVLRLVGTHTDIDKEKRQDQLIAAQNELSALPSDISEQEYLRHFLEKVEELSESQMVAYTPLPGNEETGSVPIVLYGKKVREFTIPDSVIIKSIASQGPLIINHGPEMPEGMSRMLCFPFILEKRQVAVLCLYRNEYDFFEKEVSPVNDLLHFAVEAISRIRAEKRILKLQDFLTGIISSMPTGLVSIDRNLKVTEWNRAAENLTGISKRTALNRDLIELLPQMEEERKALKECTLNRKTSQNRIAFSDGDGAKQVWEAEVYPLGEEEKTGAVLLLKNITEKLKIDELLVQSEKMLSVGGLAAGMAHELNNPLAGVMQTIYVMKRRLITSNNVEANVKAAEEAGTSLEAIKKYMKLRGIPEMFDSVDISGRRMVEIINNMLSFSQGSEARKTPKDLKKMIEDTIQLASADYDLKKKYDFRKITIEARYDESMPPLLCEGSKIQQVVLNILRNAAQAMTEDKTANPRIIVSTEYSAEDKTASFSIEDNGPGMSERTKKRIFEPFYTTKPEGTGTGLGMSISYFIIKEDHGGELLMESELGKGTRFTIRLPI